MGKDLVIALSFIGIFVIAGIGWYKLAFNNALKKVQNDSNKEKQRLSDNAKKTDDEIAGMDRDERNSHNNDWT